MKRLLALCALLAVAAAPTAPTVRSVGCQAVSIQNAARSLVTMRSLDGSHVVQIQTSRSTTHVRDILPATTYIYEVRTGTSVAPGPIVGTGRVTVRLCHR
jgi:hypothetical protein